MTRRENAIRVTGRAQNSPFFLARNAPRNVLTVWKG